MSIKALILEGGETVIANVSEVHDKEKQEFLGYRVENPYVATLVWGEKTVAAVEETTVVGEGQEAEVQFNFWAPMAAEREFDFVKDFVRVIYEPHPDTVKLYMAVLNHHQENFVRNVQGETEKTIVSMVGDDSNPAALGEEQGSDSAAFES